MLWRFSDGTTVSLGGRVEGATLLARRLREALSHPLEVSIWPAPYDQVPLDAHDPALLNAWLRAELRYYSEVRKLPLTLTEPEGVPPLPPSPWRDIAPQGAIH